MATTPRSWLVISSTSTASWRHATVFEVELLEERIGFICFRAKGKEANRLFANEAGGHRWQRVPETERRGRVQTSTITVAVLPEAKQHEVIIREQDLEWFTRRGSGPGGQHRNKTESTVDLVHKPTGIKVTADSRSQHENRATALEILRAKLLDNQRQSGILERNRERKAQVGCGMRGDKRRTIRVQDNQVTDHELGRCIPYKEYARGNFDGLLKP